jgi:HPt (histidine-containing phosphotransfer) domain-containing protein
MTERSSMYEQSERSYEVDSYPEKMARPSLRENFDAAIKMLQAETEHLFAKLDPLLAASDPRPDAIQEVDPWSSSFNSQVHELHGVASRLAELHRRIEF